jgi:hypothetical protein
VWEKCYPVLDEVRTRHLGDRSRTARRSVWSGSYRWTVGIPLGRRLFRSQSGDPGTKSCC